MDDDRTVLRSLERILVADGYDVTCCSTARSALESIAVAPPDAILLDLMMPAMNGRQFMAALHDDPSHGDIPVLVITGVRGIDVKQARSMGASDVIEKPFELDELLNKIALVLFRRQQARAEAAHAETGPAHAETGPAPAGDQAGGCPPLVLSLSADAGLTARLENWLARRGRRLLALSRAPEELGRVVGALEPAAVLIDGRLPRVGGMRALARMRREPRLDRVPLVLVRRDDDPAVAVSGRDLGFTTLVHPFTDDALERALSAPEARPGPLSRRSIESEPVV